MTLIWHTRLHEQISHHYETKDTLFHMGGVSMVCPGRVLDLSLLSRFWDKILFSWGHRKGSKMLVTGQSRVPRVRQLDFASRGPKISKRLC